MRRSWVEIDIDQLLVNLSICRENIPRSLEIMAVVKADAYGHGDRTIAKCLENNGIKYFAVSNIDEAIHLREAKVRGEVLILGYTPIERVEELIEYDFTQALISEEYAHTIQESGYRPKCQFAIDTGMRRIGINADDPDMCEAIIRKNKNILNGLFTHLCAADTPSQCDFTNNQIQKFEVLIKRVSDLALPYFHCLNSAGALWYHSDQSNIARLGIVLYGLKPDYLNELPNGIKPVMTWKSEISMIKTVHNGETIGYGRSFTATRDMKVATIPTGYADGYSRLFSNNGYVLINGYKAPIVGRICMDQMMADVSEIENISMGSEVVLIGEQGKESISADDLADRYGTIGYEVICGISKRVERVYNNTGN